MTDQKIPDYALQPAKEAEATDRAMHEEENDGFDPTPYDRLLINDKIRLTKGEAEQTAQEPEAAENTDNEPNSEAAENTDKAPNSEIGENTDNEPNKETAEAAVHMPEQTEAENSENMAELKEPEEEVYEEKQRIKPAEAAKIIPLAGKAVYEELSMTTISQKGETRVFIEEDILVPDTKPDLDAILCIDGKAILSDREIQIGQSGEENIRTVGEISLQTVYLPQRNFSANDKEAEEKSDPIATIESRLPFKNEWTINTSPLSHIVITPEIETLNFTVVNERKFRAKATVKLSIREYEKKEVPCFERIEDEKLEMLKANLQVTNVALRKKNPIDLNEELSVKEGNPLPEKILKYDINVIENHKQVTGEKMVINATVMCNVLYLGKSHRQTDSYEESEKPVPAFLQAKTEFTQFIPIEKINNVAGSKVIFDSSNLKIKFVEKDTIEASEETNSNATDTHIKLEGSIDTYIEVYKNIEKEMVQDLYNSVKSITYDYTEDKAMALKGRVTTEASVREIVNIPEGNGQIAKVVYLKGKIKDSRNTIEKGRNIVEGTMEVQLICMPEDENEAVFAISEEMPFRGAMDIPVIEGIAKADNEIYIKDLWFDKINGKQIEVNAGLLIKSTIMEEQPYKVIKNLCYVESAASQKSRPAMVIHIAKKDDSLWSIAKEYGTTVDAVKEINNIDDTAIDMGRRLLIVR